jgi:hypothetical protein
MWFDRERPLLKIAATHFALAIPAEQPQGKTSMDLKTFPSPTTGCEA